MQGPKPLQPLCFLWPCIESAYLLSALCSSTHHGCICGHSTFIWRSKISLTHTVNCMYKQKIVLKSISVGCFIKQFSFECPPPSIEHLPSSEKTTLSTSQKTESIQHKSLILVTCLCSWTLERERMGTLSTPIISTDMYNKQQAYKHWDGYNSFPLLGADISCLSLQTCTRHSLTCSWTGDTSLWLCPQDPCLQ